MDLLKVKDFLKTAESVGLQPCNLLFSDYKNFAIVSSQVYDGSRRNSRHTKCKYVVNLGNAELKPTQTEARMYEYYLSVNSEDGPEETVELSPGYGISQLNKLCEKYGVPVPQEMVAMIQALGIRN